MTLKELVERGFLNFMDYKNGLYYLEFIFSTKYESSNTHIKETHNFLGTIICNEEGDIYKAVVRSYVINEDKIYTGFPQIINTIDKITLNDIFKFDKDNIPYIGLITVKTSLHYNRSDLWVRHIKNKNNFYPDELYQSNVCIKEYIEEILDKAKVSEFFKNEKDKFQLIASSIKDAGKSVEHGLASVAMSIAHGNHELAEVHKYDEGNLWNWYH